MWQKLQGRIYGPMMSEAKLFPGVFQFMFRCKHRGYDVFIVSHKSEYGHFDPTETPLRQAALEWMTQNGFFEKTKHGTLLIDEVSEIPLETQAKILRVLIDQNLEELMDLKK